LPGVVATELREERLAPGLIDAAVCVGSDGKAVAEIFGAVESVHQGLLLAGQREVCVAPDARVATGLDFVDGASGVVGFFYDDGDGSDRRTAIDDGASKVDFRRWLLARVRRGKRRFEFR